MKHFTPLIILIVSGITLTKSFPFKKSDYRLDHTVIPVHYDLQITPYFEPDNEFGKQQFTFDGKVTISMVVTELDSKQVRLHYSNLDVSKISVLLTGDKKSTYEVVTNVSYDSDTEILTILLGNALLENQEYILTLEYSGKMANSSLGFYTGFFNVEDKVVSYGGTQAQPTFARRVFPCFDEPSLKSTFQLTIIKPKSYFAYSNTDELSVSNILGMDTYDKVIFKPTPRMSTYLVSFLIGPFIKTSILYNETNNSDLFGLIARDDMKTRITYALKTGRDILHSLGDYLDYDYYKMASNEDTIRKLDIAAVPDFNVPAMENWGLIVCREDMLLYKERFTSLYNQQKIFFVLAHEISHQWFGNLVTCDWWSSTWLNEGFALYFQYYIGYGMVPSWELKKQFLVDVVQQALLSDSDANSKPLTSSVTTQTDIISSFNEISYNKGAAFLKMVQHLLGETKFREALQQYLQLYAYSSATPDQLFNVLVDSQNENQSEYIALFKTWTTQSNYPLITVRYNSITKEAFVSQNVFKLDSMNTPSDHLWHVPLTFTTENDTFFDSKVKIIMTTASIIIPVDTHNSWLIFNVNQVGFYRVNYDTKNWAYIKRALLTKNHGGIVEENRAQIVDDLFNLARAGEITYEFAFSILEYLKTETHYLPWHSAFVNFSILFGKMNESHRSELKRFILKLLVKSFKDVGWLKSDEDARLKVYHRANILYWLVKCGHENSMRQSKSLYDVYKDDHSHEIDVDIRGLVFCGGVRNGDINDVHFMWIKYINEIDPSEKQTILSAIACASNPDAIYLALDYILSPLVQDQYRQNIFSQTYSQTAENVQHVLDYFTTNHEKIIAGFKGESSIITSVLVSLANKFTNLNQIDQTEMFYQANKNTYKTYESAINVALATARKNIEWNQANIPKIIKMIKLNYRLDETIIPRHYNLEIMPFISDHNEFGRKEFTFDGIVKIYLAVTTSESTTLRLNLKELTITRMAIIEEGNSNSDIMIISSMHDEDTEIITLVFNRALLNGGNYTLTIEYNGVIRDDMKGFYRSWFKENGEQRLMFTTKFQPTMARLVFPCFDEPHYKATFLLSIVKPIEYSAYSNTKLRTTLQYSDTYDKVEFKETPLMSTYLLAFVVAKFLPRPEIKNAKIGVIARPDQYNQSSYALVNGWSTIETMGKYLKYDYFDMVTIDGKLEKIQLLAVPDYISDATEHWGLISFRESNLLYDEEFSSLRDKQKMIITTVREVAHLWFGNLVTCDWWDYAWLNEGFGTFFEYHLAAIIDPTWELDNQFVVDIVQNGLLYDSENDKRLLNGNVDTPLQTAEMFDQITYYKGGSILRMIQHIMGNAKFVAALRSYIKKYEYQTVKPENLLNEFQEIAKDDYPNIYNVIEPWISQANYPVINVNYDSTNKQVSLTQKVFLLDATKNDTNKLWPIPLTWTTRGKGFTSTKPKHIFDTKSTKIAIDANDSWVIFNMHQIGFYRVNYDTNNWKMIKTALLQSNHDGIYEVNRAQIVDDLFNLARADELSWEFALQMLDYLKTETHYLPWTAAFKGFEFLESKIGDNHDFNEYLRELLQQTNLITQWTETPSDSQLTIYQRSNILKWFCKIIDIEWTLEARLIFNKYKNKNHTVPVNIREAVYCCAMRYGNRDDLDFLWNKFETQVVVTEQNTILNGLTCASDKNVLYELLDKILSPSVRDQDKFACIIRTITETPNNLDNVLEYLIINYKQVQISFKNDAKTISNLFTTLATKFTNSKQISTLENFLLEFYESFGDYFYTTLDILKVANGNIEWITKNVPNILKQIEENRKVPEVEGEEETEKEDEEKNDGTSYRANIFLIISFTVIFQLYTLINF